MLVWHVFPVKPTAHVQEKAFTRSYKREETKGDISQKKGCKTSSRPPVVFSLTVQVPPFWQGLGEQSSMFVSQFLPVHPTAHVHE